MDRLLLRSTSHDALRAELHRQDLFREADAARLAARAAGGAPVARRGTVIAVVHRLQSALVRAGRAGRPPAIECGDPA